MFGMEGFGGKFKILRPVLSILWSFLLAAVFVSAERRIKREVIEQNAAELSDADYLSAVANFLWRPNKSGYQHVWPVNFGIIGLIFHVDC